MWYVDNTEISRIDSKVVENVISNIEDKFGQMIVTRWKEHVFIEMDIKLMENGSAYIDERLHYGYHRCVWEFWRKIIVCANTPAKIYLFDKDLYRKSNLSNNGKAAAFHHEV